MKVQSQLLLGCEDIRHAFFTREGGVSDGIYTSLNGGVGSNDRPDNVAENRARMARALAVAPEHFLSLYQIHSPQVVVADKPWGADDRPRADAVVTKTKGLAIGVSTADCGPLLFADDRAKIIGAAHAGWRGAFSGVIENTIAAMEEIGSKRKDIKVALGPLIRQNNYEVSVDFVDQFTRESDSYARFFAPAAREGHAMFDLPGFIAARVASAGIEQFEDLGLCTYAEPDRFFSYRRSTHRAEPDYGRHINAIAIGG